jgi:hypothetical protein
VGDESRCECDGVDTEFPALRIAVDDWLVGKREEGIAY